jgi:hypothetical protein
MTTLCIAFCESYLSAGDNMKKFLRLFTNSAIQGILCKKIEALVQFLFYGGTFTECIFE